MTLKFSKVLTSVFATCHEKHVQFDELTLVASNHFAVLTSFADIKIEYLTTDMLSKRTAEFMQLVICYSSHVKFRYW